MFASRVLSHLEVDEGGVHVFRVCDTTDLRCVPMYKHLGYLHVARRARGSCRRCRGPVLAKSDDSAPLTLRDCIASAWGWWHPLTENEDAGVPTKQGHQQSSRVPPTWRANGPVHERAPWDPVAAAQASMPEVEVCGKISRRTAVAVVASG